VQRVRRDCGLDMHPYRSSLTLTFAPTVAGVPVPAGDSVWSADAVLAGGRELSQEDRQARAAAAVPPRSRAPARDRPQVALGHRRDGSFACTGGACVVQTRVVPMGTRRSTEPGRPWVVASCAGDRRPMNSCVQRGPHDPRPRRGMPAQDRPRRPCPRVRLGNQVLGESAIGHARQHRSQAGVAAGLVELTEDDLLHAPLTPQPADSLTQARRIRITGPSLRPGMTPPNSRCSAAVMSERVDRCSPRRAGQLRRRGPTGPSMRPSAEGAAS